MLTHAPGIHTQHRNRLPRREHKTFHTYLQDVSKPDASLGLKLTGARNRIY